MRFLFINDDRRRKGADGAEPRAAWPNAGRIILYVTQRVQLRMEYSLNWRSSWGVDIGWDEDLTACLCCPPLFLSFGVEGVLPSKRYDQDREFSLKFFEDSFYWKLWAPDNWDRRMPRWRSGAWTPVDTLLGRQVYTTRDLERRRIVVPMPEGLYHADALLFESCWKRPRWFAKYATRVTIDLDKMIPCEGKGENSWDCGIDGTRGITTPARSIAEGVGALVGSCLHDRVRRGGWGDWIWHKGPVESSAPDAGPGIGVQAAA